MASSTSTTEGIALAFSVGLKTEGDIPRARRIMRDAYAWLCKHDETFKPEDKDARIAELEAALRDVTASAIDGELSHSIADPDLAAQLTAAKADAADMFSRLQTAKTTLDEVRVQRDNLNRSVRELSNRTVATEIERDDLRAALAKVKAELAQVRAVNFDAPRSVPLDDEEAAARSGRSVADELAAAYDPEPNVEAQLAALDRVRAIAADADNDPAALCHRCGHQNRDHLGSACCGKTTRKGGCACMTFVAPKLAAPAPEPAPQPESKPSQGDDELAAKFAHLPPKMRQWAIDRAKAAQG